MDAISCTIPQFCGTNFALLLPSLVSLLQVSNARKVLASPPSGAHSCDHVAPTWAQQRRSVSSSPRNSRNNARDMHSRGQQSFESTLRRSRSPPKKHGVNFLSKTAPKILPNFATPTYSSLKMFNQGSPTTSFKHHHRRSDAFKAYMDSRPLHDVTNSKVNVKASKFVRHDQRQGNRANDGNQGEVSISNSAIIDDVSEISSDNDEPGPPIKSFTAANCSQIPVVQSKIDGQPIMDTAGILDTDEAIPTWGRTSHRLSQKSEIPKRPRDMTVRSMSLSRGAVDSRTKPKMDKAQMRLLYGVIDDQGTTMNMWSRNLRFASATNGKTVDKEKYSKRHRPSSLKM